MEIDIRKNAEVHVIRLRGPLRLGAAVDNLRGTFDRIFNDGALQIVVNVGDVPMIDSSGIGLLVRAQTTPKLRGGEVKLVNLTNFARQTPADHRRVEPVLRRPVK